MNLFELVNLGIEKKASDIHITVGIPPTFRINGTLVNIGERPLEPQDTMELTKESMSEKTIQGTG